MLSQGYDALHKALSLQIPASRLLHDDLSALAFGTDAGFYRLLPKLVVKAETESEIQLILRECCRRDLPLTFRAAGTSLSGQAISDSVLVMLDQGWKNIAVLDHGDRIRMQPGVLGSAANAALSSMARKIGPDPASINSAMIGGIVANNAGGMC